MSVQFARIANGVTRFGLTLGATNQLPIPLPSLAEQETIATSLDGVDATLAQLRRERDGLESLKSSIADALLTGRVRLMGKWERGQVQIVVPQADWGDGLQTDIERLLADVASHITRWLRVPVEGVIFVLPGSGESVPIAYYRGTREGPFAVQLTARDRKWSQFAYQFSHEFCHILSGHERLRTTRISGSTNLCVNWLPSSP